MSLPARRTLLLVGALLPLAGCETQPARLPAGNALPPPRPTAASTPAPMPSAATDDFANRRGRALQEAPYGPDAMPGFGSGPQVGADMEMAPIPANRFP